MNAIQVGLNGRIGMLKAVFGSADADAPLDVSTLPKMTPEKFGALFRKADR